MYMCCKVLSTANCDIAIVGGIVSSRVFRMCDEIIFMARRYDETAHVEETIYLGQKSHGYTKIPLIID